MPGRSQPGDAMQMKTWQAVGGLTAVSYAVVFAAIPSGTWLSPAGLSLGAGVAGLALMGAAAVLGSRWSFVETVFGGLDRVYQTHKWLGIWALGFASFHFLFKAGMQQWETASIVALAPPVTRFVRQLSFLGLMLIVLLALNRAIPYRVWRWWHKLSGPAFVIVIVHWLSFKSPIELTSPAGVWLAIMSVLGVAAAFWKLLLYPFFASQAEYRVESIHRGEGAVHLELSPVGREIPFIAGQFAFVQMKEDGLREPHPFTIASAAGRDGRVHFVIRALGDFTEQLVARAAVGMRADVFLPYGRFHRPKEAKSEIWIGGGVGISPFIAWMSDRTGGSLANVTLFYFYTPGREFPPVPVLNELAQDSGLTVVPAPAGPDDPDFKQRFAQLVHALGPGDVQVSFCGPKGLLKALRGQMRALGVPESHLHYEYFQFR